MKVLQLAKFYPPVLGGIETTVRDIAEGLTRRRWSVSVLCANTEQRTVVEDGAIRVVRAASLGKVASTSMAPALVGKLMQWRQQDVVHVHVPDPMTNLALFIARPRGKLVVHWHSDIVKQKTLLKLYAPLQGWLLRRADVILCTSPPYAESSLWLQPYRSKIRFVPSCIVDPLYRVDPARLAAQAAALRTRHGGRRLVFALGRMTYYKGFEYLVRAAAHLPPDVQVLIGGDGELLDSLRALSTELGVQDRVEFVGRVPADELAAHYQAADVFCLPSIMRSEAFGLVMVEAMAHSKPVVATDIPGSGVPWVNQDGVTGLNVPPADPPALAKALLALLDDPERARALGLAGRRRFEEALTVERMIDAVEAAYAACGVPAASHP